MPKFSTISIVIPVFNEAKSIHKILERVVSADSCGLKKEIIIVNDGSSDGTLEVLHKLNSKKQFIIISYPKNHGKGYAMRQGIHAATGDFVLVQDADLEYSPKDYPKLLKPLLAKETTVVYGSRRIAENNKRYSSIFFFLGGILVSKATNFLFGSKLTDVTTGYKVFRRDLLQKVDLTCDGFEFCDEVTAKLLNLDVKITEVPIAYYPRPVTEGKKIKWKDGVIAIWTLFRFAPVRHLIIALIAILSAFLFFSFSLWKTTEKHIIALIFFAVVSFFSAKLLKHFKLNPQYIYLIALVLILAMYILSSYY